MFPGKRGLTKRIPAGLSSARACASAQGPSRKESGGLSPSFILLQKNISPKDQMFSRGAKTLAETRTAALNFTQSCCLSSYAWGFTCWQFQHLLPKSHLPSAFLSSLFFSAFPPCAATHLPSPSWREVLPWEASNRRLPNAEWSLPYLDGDHPGFTVLGLRSSLWSNSSEDKGASPVKQSSESSPWLSPPWISQGGECCMESCFAQGKEKSVLHAAEASPAGNLQNKQYWRWKNHALYAPHSAHLL